MIARRILATLVLAALSFAAVGCTGGATNSGGGNPPPPPPGVSVSVSPSTATVRVNESVQFTATVTGTPNTAVNWAVNGVVGGDFGTVGAINPQGRYYPPPTVPNPNQVRIEAVWASNSNVKGSAQATVQNPQAAITTAWPGNLPVGSVSLVIDGSGFMNGSQVVLNGAVLTTTLVSGSRVLASGTIPNTISGAVPVLVRNPDPGANDSNQVTLQVHNSVQVSPTAAARFLEQATFGPTAQTINQVSYVGFQNFLNDQFNAPSSTFDDPGPNDTSPDPLQRRWFTNALFGPDQLRQRMALALHKIWVVSWVVVDSPQAFAPYLRVHQQHAFGNYRQIMENVTKNPAMGRYQDIANNDGAPNRSGNCNENYGRELMQLFTLGLWRLNLDGTVQRDGQGNPVPAYDPVATVEQNACAMTGWTYANAPGQSRSWNRPPYYGAPMEAVESHHDQGTKTLIDGFVVPPGGTAQQDLTLVLDNIFCHSNIAPFVSKLLIQQFVTSNPSPAYVQRVASAFAGSGSCTPGSAMPASRGDMRAVIQAILLDPEARRGDTLPPSDPQVASDGKLKEPLLLITNLYRAIGAVTDGSNLATRGSGMGQNLLFPPTVFSYFSPEFLIPGSTTLYAPELNIYTTNTTFQRINFVNTITFSALGGTQINWDTHPFTSLAASPDAPGQLLDVLNMLMLRGKMTSQMRASLLTAINAVPAGSTQNRERARTAVYLIASSSQYQVQH